MQIEIQNDTSKKIEETARILGIKNKELIDRAILLYLDNINKFIELKQETKEWDVLSDDALINFEDSL